MIFIFAEINEQKGLSLRHACRNTFINWAVRFNSAKKDIENQRFISVETSPTTFGVSSSEWETTCSLRSLFSPPIYTFLKSVVSVWFPFIYTNSILFDMIFHWFSEDGVFHLKPCINYWGLLHMTFSISWQMFLSCRCQKSAHRINARLSAFSMALQFANKIPTVVNGLIRFGGRNGSSLLYRTENPTFQLAKRNASIHTNNRFVRMVRAEHVTSLGWALLVRTIYFQPYESYNRVQKMLFLFQIVPVSTFGLGLWQIQRKKWKVALVNKLQNETNRPVVDLPEE